MLAKEVFNTISSCGVHYRPYWSQLTHRLQTQTNRIECACWFNFVSVFFVLMLLIFFSNHSRFLFLHRYTLHLHWFTWKYVGYVYICRSRMMSVACAMLIIRPVMLCLYHQSMNFLMWISCMPFWNGINVNLNIPNTVSIFQLKNEQNM